MKNKNSILYIIIGILLVGLFFVFLTNTNSNKAPVVTTTTQDPNINTPTTINTKTQTQPVYFKGSDFLVLTKEDMLLLLQQGSTSSSRNEGLKSLSVGVP